jgi:lipoprotein-anchoring transpeptidase ErfK/SrfK
MLLALACAAPVPAPAMPPIAAVDLVEPDPVPPDPFDLWLAADQPVADGFGPPVATAKRCGDGCWVARSGPVVAVAAGTVTEVGEDSLVTEHLFYDDDRRVLALRWSGVRPAVAVGQVVARGDPVGVAVADVRITGPAKVDAFFRAHGRLLVPQDEAVLAIIDRGLHRMRVYADGEAVGTYEVGLGQADGDKEKRGDNRTPRGLYRVVEKSTGPFGGPWADYYGGHWVKLSYPNPWDAARGQDAGLIDAGTRAAIERAFWAGQVPPQGTKLGGGIGLHGWVAEWPDASDRRMSWGCVVLHLSDVATIYDALPMGAMVAIR